MVMRLWLKTLRSVTLFDVNRHFMKTFRVVIDRVLFTRMEDLEERVSHKTLILLKVEIGVDEEVVKRQFTPIPSNLLLCV